VSKNKENKTTKDSEAIGVDTFVICVPLITDIIYFGKEVKAACDKRCEKAWGINQRSKKQLSEDEDDYVYLTDFELDDAPMNPGTYEGADGKPFKPDKHNKWCVRECERCKLLDVGEEIRLKDFTKPIYNIPSAHI